MPSLFLPFQVILFFSYNLFFAKLFTFALTAPPLPQSGSTFLYSSDRLRIVLLFFNLLQHTCSVYQIVNPLICFTIFRFIAVLVHSHTITSYLSFYYSYPFGSFQRHVPNIHLPFLPVPLPLIALLSLAKPATCSSL